MIGRKVWLIGGLVVVVALAAGLALGPTAFAGNLLAELVGVVVGVAVALTLVERLLERERSRRWERVRTLTSWSVGAEVHAIAIVYADAMPAGSVRSHFTTSLDTRLPTPESINLMRKIAAYIRTHKHELATVHKKDFDRATSRRLWNEVAPHVAHLRDITTPRVVELADDPRLVECLVSIDSNERHWLRWIELSEQTRTAHHEPWRFSADLLDAAADTVERLVGSGGSSAVGLLSIASDS